MSALCLPGDDVDSSRAGMNRVSIQRRGTGGAAEVKWGQSNARFFTLIFLFSSKEMLYILVGDHFITRQTYSQMQSQPFICRVISQSTFNIAKSFRSSSLHLCLSSCSSFCFGLVLIFFLWPRCYVTQASLKLDI